MDNSSKTQTNPSPTSNPSPTTPIQLGKVGPEVFPLALGCMGMGQRSMYGDSDEGESIATIHAALERGVNLLDTGDFYSLGRNELLVGKALQGRRDQALVSVKFGALRSPDGAFSGYDSRPAAVKNFLGYSLARLGLDHIDIYRPSRLDPDVPIEDTIGAIADMIQAGYVRYIGLSEVGPETIRRAAAVHPIVDLQIEYSLLSRGPEARILPTLTELGIATTAYGVLCRGLLTGSKPAKAGDLRNHMPRFTGDNGQHNQRFAQALARIAAQKGVKPSALAIAWARAKGRRIVPLIGARTRDQLADSLAALDVTLSESEVTMLEQAVPAAEVAGTRYAPALMVHLDSER